MDRPVQRGRAGPLDEFRIAAREWEVKAEGLLQSFVGKLPGLAVRLALVLAYLDWAAEKGEEPHEIGLGHFGQATHLVESYILPMAKRAYAEASLPAEIRAARRLLAIIREQKWKIFSVRDVQRLGRSGFQKSADIHSVLAELEEGDLIKKTITGSSSQGGRPSKAYRVNPIVFEADE